MGFEYCTAYIGEDSLLPELYVADAIMHEERNAARMKLKHDYTT